MATQKRLSNNFRIKLSVFLRNEDYKYTDDEESDNEELPYINNLDLYKYNAVDFHALRYFPDGESNSYGLSKLCETIDFSIIRKFPGDEWDWWSLSSNKTVFIQDIIDFSDKPWCWVNLTRHVNITPSHIKKYNHLPWNDLLFCRNPNLTYKDIIEMQYINWYSLYDNKFRSHRSGIPSKNLIFKTYHIYRLNKLFKSIQNHAKRIVYIKDITILPGIGIEYFKAAERFCCY